MCDCACEHFIATLCARLERAAFHCTPLRRNLLRLLYTLPRLDIRGIRSQLDARFNQTATLPAIYANLSRLESMGIVRRMHTETRATYELRLKSNHLHLVCRRCRRVTELPDAPFFQAVRTRCTRDGFEAHDFECIVYGICHACQNDND